MPSIVEALLGDSGGKVSYQLSWMRWSYDFLSVVPESRRITYGGYSCVSDDMESLSECYADGDAAIPVSPILKRAASHPHNIQTKTPYHQVHKSHPRMLFSWDLALLTVN